MRGLFGRGAAAVSALLRTGRIVDLALLVTALELGVFTAYNRRTGRGVAPRSMLGNLLSGASLLLALRGAVAGAGRSWIAPCLGAALLAHLADLRQRWRR